MGYRSDSIAISRDMGPLSLNLTKILKVGISKAGIPTVGIPKTEIPTARLPKIGKTHTWTLPKTEIPKGSVNF